jgi:hypothetical protein
MTFQLTCESVVMYAVSTAAVFESFFAWLRTKDHNPDEAEGVFA